MPNCFQNYQDKLTMAKIKKTATAKNTEEKKTDSAKSQVASQELEESLKRALADYHNLEKRVEEERKLLSRLSASLLIEKLLPILDNLEQAQSHLNDEGLAIVIKQFRDVLAAEGVEEIPAEGTQFDPHLHEAVETQSGDNDNLVAKVLIKGYKMESTVIRPAKVIVVKKLTQENPGQNQPDEAKEVNDYA